MANWFANARRRLKIAEKRSGGDLAAKLAAISQSDNQMDMQMDIDESIEDIEDNFSEGEGELQIDLGGKTTTTTTAAELRQTDQQKPTDFPFDSRYVPTTAQQQQQQVGNSTAAIVVKAGAELQLGQQRNNNNNNNVISAGNIGVDNTNNIGVVDNTSNNSILQRYLNELPSGSEADAGPILVTTSDIVNGSNSQQKSKADFEHESKNLSQKRKKAKGIL